MDQRNAVGGASYLTAPLRVGPAGVAPLIGWLVLGETLTLRDWAGMTLTIAGIALMALLQRRRHVLAARRAPKERSIERDISEKGSGAVVPPIAPFQ